MSKSSGWCMDGHCNDCRYPPCTHEHHHTDTAHTTAPMVTTHEETT